MRSARTSRWGAVFSMVLVLVVVTVAGCSPAETQNTLKQVQQKGQLTVGSDTTYAPMEFLKDNAITGFDVDLMNAIGDRIGLKCTVMPTAWEGIIAALQTRKFDALISSITITPEREKEVAFTIPYYRADMGILFNKTLHDIQGPSDLAGLNVGVQVGTTGDQAAAMIDGVKKLSKYPDIQLAIADLELGRIDAVVNDYPVCAFYAQNNKDLAVVGTPKIGNLDLTQYYGIAIRTSDTELKQAFDNALKGLAADGVYDTIYAKWFGGKPVFRPGDPISPAQ
ncbi:MAG: basic amino acid ABC transporter substrate-binding protein [Candidatus Cryosericum sp.]|jgi:lysine-arginine-ornithine-binding protein